MRYLMILMFVFSLLYPVFAYDLPAPPFRKVWACKVGNEIMEQPEYFTLCNGTICYDANKSYGAIDVLSGKLLWKKSVKNQYLLTARCENNRFYVALEQEEHAQENSHTGRAQILACDPTSGKELLSLSLEGLACHPAIKDHIVYCFFDNDVLKAIDMDTKNTLWATTIPERFEEDKKPTYKPYGDRKELIADRTNLFIQGHHRLLCINRQTGMMRWQYEIESAYWRLSEDEKGEHIYPVLGEELRSLSVLNGRLEWTFGLKSGVHSSPVSQNGMVIVASRDGMLYALQADSGKVRWTFELSKSFKEPISKPLAKNNTIIVSAGTRLIALSLSGKKLWEFDNEAYYFSDIEMVEGGFLFSHHKEILRYTMGAPPEVPSIAEGRRLAAEELVSRFDSLGEDEKRFLGKLGDEAFEALLPIVRERLRMYDTAPREKSSLDEDYYRNVSDKSPEYYEFDHALGTLQSAMSERHTPELFSLLAMAQKDTAKYAILKAVSQKGDEKLAIPFFLEKLRAGRKKDKETFDYLYSTALHTVADSKHPAAVEYLIQQLADSQSSIRHVAYLSLGLTGGDRGAQAILAARDTTRTIPSLEDYATFYKLGMEVRAKPDIFDDRLVEVRKDSGGTLWGLAQSYVLGSFRDAWILKSDGRKWISPVFTGINIGEIKGVKSEWITTQAHNTDLARDSDGDGWTDEVEKRLGTNPVKQDSDGDGLIDSTDKNPLAAPRALSETEKVLRAAFEGLFCFSSGDGFRVPCLVKLPEGIEPMEFIGYDWIIIPERRGEITPLAKAVAGEERLGVGVVSFHMPQSNFDGNVVRDSADDIFILWNNEKTEAKLLIHVFYGNLNAYKTEIHLKKYGDDWIVVKIQIVSVS